MQKSGKVKLQVTDKGLWDKTVVLPSVGETVITAEGIMEVEDMVATVLLRQTDSYLLVEGNGTTVTEEIHEEKVAEKPKKETKKVKPKKEEPKKEEPNAEEVEKESDGLDEMTLTELKEIAKDSGFEESEYKKFQKSKKLMINFLRKNA